MKYHYTVHLSCNISIVSESLYDIIDILGHVSHNKSYIEVLCDSHSDWKAYYDLFYTYYNCTCMQYVFLCSLSFKVGTDGCLCLKQWVSWTAGVLYLCKSVVLLQAAFTVTKLSACSEQAGFVYMKSDRNVEWIMKNVIKMFINLLILLWYLI